MNDDRVYLTNLTPDAEPGMQTITSRPPERIIFVLLEHTQKPIEPS